MFALLFVSLSSSASWFSTKGNKIINSAGETVRISGLNWFGFDTSTNVFHGLWNANIHKILEDVEARGFNCFRVPISAQLIHQWKDGNGPKELNINYYSNPDLEGLSTQEVFDFFLAECKKLGLRVFIDIHGIMPDSYTDMLWYSSEHPTEYWLSALEYFADHYKSDDTIIGIDIKNEPHGCGDDNSDALWDDSKADNNWKYAAEQGAKRVLAKNPNLLIFIEGTECYDGSYGWWGGNLQGVKDYPIDLGQYQNKLVYAPHEYGPDLYDQWWFHVEYDDFNYNSLMKHHWHYHWLYIVEDGTAPLLIGEWGGILANERQIRWLKLMVELITNYGLSQTFWCLNPNSGDTGGLLTDDWETWDEDKYNLIKPVLTGKLI